MHVFAQTTPTVGVTPEGDHWFLSPSGMVVVFQSDGRVLVDGALIGGCPRNGIAETVIGTLVLACDDGSVELVEIGPDGPNVYSLDDGEMTLVSGETIISREVGTLSPQTPEQALSRQPSGNRNSGYVSPEGSDVAGCPISLGDYQFLAGDMSLSYFTQGTITLRVDGSGDILAYDGDFDVSFRSQRFSRVGDQFSHTNENGTYTRVGLGEITFTPGPSLAAAVAAAPVGTVLWLKAMEHIARQPSIASCSSRAL